jgi:hypothetical protein
MGCSGNTSRICRAFYLPTWSATANVPAESDLIFCWIEAMSGGFLTFLRGLSDPVQRRWLLGRLRRRWQTGPETSPPAYLDGIPSAEPPGRLAFSELSPHKQATILLTLPGGETLRVASGKVDGVLDRQWDDPASAAAFHSFVWTSQDPDGLALAVLWPAWVARYGRTSPSALAWDPDITAERSISLLDMARRKGMPRPCTETAALLAAHAAILLNSFTNRAAPPAALARRAHALIRLGLDLAMPATADFGMTALLAECQRIFLPSGVSNLESTHFHLRFCQSLADVWLAARRENRAETASLESLLRRALAVVPILTLPGGFPLIGDIVEGLPVGWLNGLIRGNAINVGWTGHFPPEEQTQLALLRDQSLYSDLEDLHADGWLRVDQQGWSGLWHAVPCGWPGFDGYGHQDLGSCELHFGGVPIFVDPGGSRMGGLNGRAFCRKASAHGGLQLDRHDLYPLNHPDYSDAFRREVGGTPPRLQAEFDGASLVFGALAGIGGLREGSRRWYFKEGGLVIDDMLNGTGRHLVCRRLLTPLAVRKEDAQTVLLEGQGQRFRLISDQPVTVDKGFRWIGFGTTAPLSVIEIGGRKNLPWRGHIRILPA